MRRYFWIFSLFIVAVCMLLLGRSAMYIVFGNLFGNAGRVAFFSKESNLAARLAEKISYHKEPRAIHMRNLFCPTCPLAPSKEELEKNSDPVKQDEKAIGGVRPTTLPIAILGPITWTPDPKYAYAVLNEKGVPLSNARPAYAGNKIFNTGAVVMRVDIDKVWIRLSNGQLEYILPNSSLEDAPITPPTKAPPVVSGFEKELMENIHCRDDGHSCEVNRTLLDKLVKDTYLAFSGVYAMPAKEGNGLKLTSVNPNSFLGRIGLKKGDTLLSVNNQKFDNVAAATTMASTLSNAKQFQVVVQRNGKTETLNYQVK